MFVRMRRTFSHDQENGTRRTIPAGWAGNLDDAIAQQAIDGGYTSEPQAADPAADQADVVPGDADKSMTRAALEEMARASGIDPEPYRTKAELAAAINGA